MTKVAIVGVGAIGGMAAALLEITGLHEITLCTRRPLEKLVVTTPEGVISVKGRNITDPAQAEIVDWAIVATKTYDSEGTSDWLKKLCGKDGPIAILQNGVEHRERFANLMNPERIVPVIVDCPVERKENGNILQRGAAQMRVENSRLGQKFTELFRGSRAEIELVDDFVTAAWQKLCMNSAGAISALTMKPAGVLQDEALGRVALEIIAECVAVGRAEGAQLEETIGQQVLEKYRAQPPDSINSILADRIAGRSMEIHARNGVIVRKGEKYGIKTPVNRMVVALLNAMAAAEPEVPHTV